MFSATAAHPDPLSYPFRPPLFSGRVISTRTSRCRGLKPIVLLISRFIAFFYPFPLPVESLPNAKVAFGLIVPIDFFHALVQRDLSM